ncbi:hypothetical protein SUGI_0659850 [Cryptomeria japonica]|nr:hypothetical protein SUGI_0659850 [Cryptomeria japonica]
MNSPALSLNIGKFQLVLEPIIISDTLSREEAANILDAASNPGGPPWRSSTQSIATDDQALALHSDVNFSGAPLRCCSCDCPASANWQALSLISKILANRIDLSRLILVCNSSMAAWISGKLKIKEGSQPKYLTKRATVESSAAILPRINFKG